MTERESMGRDLAIETVVAIATAGAGAAIEGAAGAAAGAGVAPALTSGLQLLASGVVDRRRQRGAEVFRSAAERLGFDEDAFAEELLGSDRLTELAGRLFLIAQDSSLAQKRRALAAVLANAASGGDDAAVEHGILLLPALTELDAPHIRFLSAIEPARRRPASAGDDAEFGWKLEQVTARDPSLQSVVLPLLQSLIALGLVENATGGLTFLDSAKSYALSPLGEEMLALLRV